MMYSVPRTARRIDRAHSSVEEHLPYKQGVAGSNPAVPTYMA